MSELKNRFYASTGTIVGRVNGFDHRVIIDSAKKIDCDGFELMMLKAWYGKLDMIAEELTSAGIYFPVIHFDKEIGIMLAEDFSGEHEKATGLFAENIKLGKAVGAKKAVFHLWGGPKSDSDVGRAIELLPQLRAMCGDAGITLMIENIPCVYSDPLSVWGRIALKIPDMPLIFDTRFGAFHDQYMDIFASPLWKNVKHMHISSYSGAKNEWGLIRPILHPGEGRIDFDHLISNLPHYESSVTLESPVLSEDGKLDIEKLNRSLTYLREKFAQYRPDEKPVKSF